MAELCITPAQLNHLSSRREGPPSPTKQRSLHLKEITPYQREIHCVAKYGAGLATGLQATSLSTRPGEIVGRFQRLLVRPGGGRPSADGWYLVRVARMLPDALPTKQSDKTGSTKGATSTTATSGYSTRIAGKSEDGDVSLLSELCRRLEVGFMAIASRQQRALLRTKALDRVLACCEGFSAAHGTTMMPSPVLADDATESGAVDGYKLLHVSTTIGSENNSESRGRSPIPIAAGKSTPSGGNSTVAQRQSKPSSAYAIATGGRSADANEAGREIVFSVPVQPPTAAETIDGRKGVLVSLKDGRLAVLVRQAETSLAVVELPRGKQQSLPEREVRRSTAESTRTRHVIHFATCKCIC